MPTSFHNVLYFPTSSIPLYTHLPCLLPFPTSSYVIPLVLTLLITYHLILQLPTSRLGSSTTFQLSQTLRTISPGMLLPCPSLLSPFPDFTQFPSSLPNTLYYEGTLPSIFTSISLCLPALPSLFLRFHCLPTTMSLAFPTSPHSFKSFTPSSYPVNYQHF